MEIQSHRSATRVAPCLAIALAILTAPLAGPTASAATFSAGTNTRLLDVTIDPQLDNGSEPVVAESQGSTSTSAGTVSGESRSEAQAGGIRLSSVLTAKVDQGVGTVYGQAEASGRAEDDFVVLAANAPSGTVARMTVAFDVSGDLGVTGAGQVSESAVQWGGGAEWRAAFNLNTGIDGALWNPGGRIFIDPFNSFASGDTPGRRTFTVDVTLGVPVSLSISGRVEARGSASAPTVADLPAEAVASALFGNTVAWDGILSLTDANGIDLGPFTAVSSATGFDYASAYAAVVPAPGAVWLLGSAVGAFWLRARRRRIPT
jgi:hypothetical protein